jgi:ATP-binding cassette subfamily B protein
VAAGASVIHQLWAWGRPYLPHYGAGCALLVLTNGLGVWIPWLLRDAVRAIERGAALRVVAGLVLAMAAVAGVQAVVRTASRLVLLGASRKVVHDVRNAFFDRLQQMGPAFYDSRRIGDLMSRGVNDTGLIQSVYGPGVLNLLNTAIVYVAVLVLLLRIDATLTLIALSLYPPLFLGVKRISRRVHARSLAVAERLADLSDRAQESISGIQQVKIHAQEQREVERFARLGEAYRRGNLSMATARGAMVSLIGVVSGLTALVVLYFGGRFVVERRIDFGDFVAFNAYLGLLVGPTIALGFIVNIFERGAGATRRIAELLGDAAGAPAEGGPEAADTDARPLAADIEIRGLSFRYPALAPGAAPASGSRAALHDIHLGIPQGSRVAVVGPVGSGKSTLANLIAGLYPAPPGTLFVGGEDVAAVSPKRLRLTVGYVPQEAFLFSRSLRENIALGGVDATDEALERAVDLAHLRGDVEALPRGLDTLVGERGVTLSGGQRQRATLARALVGERRIVILDDSLSSVDAEAEQAILEALNSGGRERTLILITHRLTALHEMDRIVVLDAGRVVEQGTHDELLAKQGLYATLARRHRLERRLAP